jgi:hypothetical protein
MDTIERLMANTAAGFHSEIVYDKDDGRPVTQRVIEPRKLVEGRDGLLVRALQVQPERGFRAFCSGKIVQVTRHPEPLLPERKKSNMFCTGEVVCFRTSTAEDSKDAQSDASELDTLRLTAHGRAAWTMPWFNSYASAVRSALLDLKLEPHEILRLESLRKRLSLSDEQVRAVHAYIMGEELLGLSSDGWYDTEEAEAVGRLAACFCELNASPLLL